LAISVPELTAAGAAGSASVSRDRSARRSAVRLATVASRAHGKRRCPQLVLQMVGVVAHCLERVGTAAELVTEPGHLLARPILGASSRVLQS
jgi:hypothetical protein